MDPRDSGIFRLASVGSYLDALSTITDEMSLKERSNLIFLDRCLHERWGLGENVILNWCPEGDGIALLIVPHYAIAGYASAAAGPPARGAPSRPKQEFFQVLLSGRRCLTPAQLTEGRAAARHRVDASAAARAAQEHARRRTRSSRRWSSATASPTSRIAACACSTSWDSACCRRSSR